uniref:39S ribosomal protein L35, mitochondrial n=1 Tax=Steinernema glaseri TaxID=37863 RepID=A0A1I7YXL1_9BILA
MCGPLQRKCDPQFYGLCTHLCSLTPTPRKYFSGLTFLTAAALATDPRSDLLTSAPMISLAPKRSRLGVVNMRSAHKNSTHARRPTQGKTRGYKGKTYSIFPEDLPRLGLLVRLPGI